MCVCACACLHACVPVCVCVCVDVDVCVCMGIYVSEWVDVSKYGICIVLYHTPRLYSYSGISTMAFT